MDHNFIFGNSATHTTFSSIYQVEVHLKIGKLKSDDDCSSVNYTHCLRPKKENRAKKFFTITTLIAFISFSAACSTIIGAYSDDPYGHIVNCDAVSPMDKLLQCVENQYAKMDNIYEHPFTKDQKTFDSKLKNDDIASKLIPTSVRKTDVFNSIKSCYNEDKCMFSISQNQIGLVTYDKYKDKAVRILNSNRTTTIEVYTDKIQNKFKDPYIGGYSNKGVPYKFFHSHKSKGKDIIIFEKKNKTFIYATLIETINIKNNKSLIIANIQEFCPSNAIKKPQLTPKGLYNKAHFDPCGIYRFSYVTDKIEGNVPIFISLDTRIDPQKIYLKIAKDVFEVDINNQGESQ